MNKVIKPLLATKAVYDKIQYPVLTTPKLDGIRCLMVDGVAMSRSMKPIPNLHVRHCLEGLNHLDGELMVNGDFNAVQSGIMASDGEPDFTYHVFDDYNNDCGYLLRIEDLEFNDVIYDEHCKILKPVWIHNEAMLDTYLNQCIELGYEGVMIRKPHGKYKFGRSTVNEGILLKIKKFHDDEGILVGVIEKMTNTNELEADELGYAKRSSKKENLIPAGTAGSVVLKWTGQEFRVGFGPGWTNTKKQELWNNRESFKGELVKFSYQELSKDGIPRFGKMLEIRHKDDL